MLLEDFRSSNLGEGRQQRWADPQFVEDGTALADERCGCSIPALFYSSLAGTMIFLRSREK